MRVISRVRAILDAGIVVCGHIGLTPQSSGQLGGHKAQGRTLESAPGWWSRTPAPCTRRASSCCCVEAVPPEVAAFIRAELPIPVLGIGAGSRRRRPAAHRLRRARHLPGLHAQVRQEVRRPRRGRPRRPSPSTSPTCAPAPSPRRSTATACWRASREVRRVYQRMSLRARQPTSSSRSASRSSAPRRSSPSPPRPPRWPPRARRSTRSISATLTSRRPRTSSQASLEAIRDGKTTYCPNAGIPQLREALAVDVSRARGLDYAARERLRAARRQAGDRQVPAHPHGPGRRGALSQPGLPHLRLADRLLRRRRRALRLPRGHRALPPRPRGHRAADHAAHAPSDPQRPAQPHGRRVHPG